MSIAIRWRRPGPGQPDLSAGPDQASIRRDLVDRVRVRIGLSSRQEADRIARITLQYLLARLSESLRRRLLHELPKEVGRYLQQHPAAGQPFEPPEGYFAQIALEAELEPAVAKPQAVAVCTTIADSLPEAVLREIAGEVPRVFQALFPERAGLAHLPSASRVSSDAVIPLFGAPTTTPSYLGLDWHCSSQQL